MISCPLDMRNGVDGHSDEKMVIETETRNV